MLVDLAPWIVSLDPANEVCTFSPVQEESSPKAEENKHKTAKNAKKENRDRKRSKVLSVNNFLSCKYQLPECNLLNRDFLVRKMRTAEVCQCHQVSCRLPMIVTLEGCSIHGSINYSLRYPCLFFICESSSFLMIPISMLSGRNKDRGLP